MTNKLYGTVLLKTKKIMDVLLNAKSSLTLEEISSKSSIPKPTTFKILNTLVYINFVRKNGDDKKYSIGTKMIGYGTKALNDFNIVSISKPYLEELCKSTKETINLGIEENLKVVLLKKIDSPQVVNLNSQVGGTMELYTSAMGKAILSTKSDEELEQYFSKLNLTPLTQNTIVSKNQLQDQIKTVRKNGYAIDNQENQTEIVCIGVAIQKYGRVFGAISVSTPKYRLDKALFEEQKRLILSAKKQIIENI